MAYGIEIDVGDTTVVDSDTDDVIGFSIIPQYTEQIEPLVRGAAPFIEDRGNVMAVLTVTAVRTHSTLAEAAIYLLEVINDTPRSGDVSVSINDGVATTVLEMAGAIARVEPGPFVGATTTATFTFIGAAPATPEPDEEE